MNEILLFGPVVLWGACQATAWFAPSWACAIIRCVRVDPMAGDSHSTGVKIFSSSSSSSAVSLAAVVRRFFLQRLLPALGHPWLHYKPLETLDTVAHFILVCWSDVHRDTITTTRDYTAGVIGSSIGAWLGVRMLNNVLREVDSRKAAALADTTMVGWFFDLASTVSNYVFLHLADDSNTHLHQRGKRVITWIGGSSFVSAIAGFRFLYYGDLSAGATVVPPLFRRLTALWSSFRRQSQQSSSDSVQQQQLSPQQPQEFWRGMFSEELTSPTASASTVTTVIRDAIDISCFSVGMMLGAGAKLWFYCDIGYRTVHGGGVMLNDAGAAVGERVHELIGAAAPPRQGAVAAAAPPHPVHVSPALQDAFVRGKAPNEFICPLTQVLFVNPVIAADGHTYEADDMIRWMSIRMVSPILGTPLLHRYLTPNYALRSLMERWHEGGEGGEEERVPQ